MARYIDADKCPCNNCETGCISGKCYAFFKWLEGCDYDVEAVVAELEKLKEEYEHHCINGAWQRGAIDGAKIALSKTLSIVRGKE